MLETIRVSKRARDQLITLKRRTGIPTWNVLSRWAFCLSLAEPGVPTKQRITTDSSIEMTWRTFGGDCADIFLALLKERCRQDGVGVDDEMLEHQFRLHLHRGIAYLAADPSLIDLDSLLEKAVRAETQSGDG